LSIIPYLIHIPLLLFLVFWFKRRFESDPLSGYYYPSLILKIAAGIILGLIYQFYYNSFGDTFYLFERSSHLASLFYNEPERFFKVLLFNTNTCDQCDPGLIFGMSIEKDPRNLFYVKVLSLINLITFNSYWLSSVYLSFFSFLGFYFLSNTILKIFNFYKVEVSISLLFFPSVLLWSSGVMKESIVMGSLTFAVSIVLLWLYKLKKAELKGILFLLVFMFLMFKIKYYYFAILVPVLASLSFVKIIQERYIRVRESVPLQLFLFFVIFSGITIIVSRLHPNLHLDHFSEALVYNYNSILARSDGRNSFYFEGIEPRFTNILMHFPKAAFIGFFRPFVWETHNVWGLITAVENSVIFILFISSFGKLIIDILNKKKLRIGLEYSAMLTYVVLLAFVISIASPNWGSLSRYKIGYLPFLVLLVLIRNPFIALIPKKFYGIDSR
jgi:hypothetical protein